MGQYVTEELINIYILLPYAQKSHGKVELKVCCSL